MAILAIVAFLAMHLCVAEAGLATRVSVLSHVSLCPRGRAACLLRQDMSTMLLMHTAWVLLFLCCSPLAHGDALTTVQVDVHPQDAKQVRLRRAAPGGDQADLTNFSTATHVPHLLLLVLSTTAHHDPCPLPFTFIHNHQYAKYVRLSYGTIGQNNVVLSQDPGFLQTTYSLSSVISIKTIANCSRHKDGCITEPRLVNIHCT